MVTRRLQISIICAIVLAGCAGIATPAAVSPTLDAWRTLGLACGTPHADTESDLLQWRCTGTIEGATIAAILDGDDQGVVSILAQLPRDTGADLVREAFAGLVDATPALGESRQRVQTWIRALDAVDVDTGMDSVRVSIQHDATWITLVIFPGPRASVSSRER